MTAIVIWLNKNDDFLPGLWAVSDSRISNSDNVLTETYPKVSAIYAMAYDSFNIPKLNPRHVLSVGYAFSGSTLIGSAVREVLSTILSNLNEVKYYDVPDLEFDSKIPSLEEVAILTGNIASHYVMNLGINVPGNAKIEISIFGYCSKSQSFRIYRIRNTPANPAEVIVGEESIDDGSNVSVFGDRCEEIKKAVLTKKMLFARDSINWDRAPILAMMDIAKNPNYSTIGGRLQLYAAGRFGIRHVPFSEPERFAQMLAGFDLLKSGLLGGFSYSQAISLTQPGPTGWS